MNTCFSNFTTKMLKFTTPALVIVLNYVIFSKYDRCRRVRVVSYPMIVSVFMLHMIRETLENLIIYSRILKLDELVSK